MKSRISFVFTLGACLLFFASAPAFSQDTTITAAPAATEDVAPVVAPESASPVASETSEPATEAPLADTAVVEEVPASTDVSAAAESAEASVTDDESAEAMPEDAGVEEEAAEASTAEVIELTPEEQNVAGAEITANPEDEDKISVTLDNVPLQDVIRMFTRISGANIVSGTNLVGNVTVNLQDVEWEPALKVILDVVDMALVEKSEGIFAVISKGDLASEPVVSETLFLNYNTVSNILPVIQKLLSSTNASVAGFPAANAIVIQETRPRLNLIKEAVSMIDRPRAQVLIEAKFVELNDQAIKDLGINWQSLQGYTVRMGAPTYSYGKTRTDREGYDDSTVFRDVTQDAFVNGASSSKGKSKSNTSADGTSATAGSDSSSSSSFESATPPGSASMTDSSGSGSSSSASQSQSTSANSASGSDAFDGNINVNGKNFTSFDFAAGTIETIPTADRTRTVTDFLENETVSTIGAILSGDEFALTLSALKQNSGVEIVSNPKIVVASGEQATIHVGVKLPNYETRGEAGAGTTIVTRRELSATLPFIDTGVILNVEPTVNTESNITVKITPELSRTLPSTSGFPGDIPPIQTRRIVSQFNLESGRTVAIGGLTQTDDRERVSKIPFLGDIPIIGKYLFSHTHTERGQDEVIIFVTVAIANPAHLIQSSGIPEDGKLIYRHLARRVEENARAAEDSKSKKKKKPDWLSTKH
ncbi:MAG: secretin N-terminal domain-containing protein [bacterium]